jgi:hypothetical protein
MGKVSIVASLLKRVTSLLMRSRDPSPFLCHPSVYSCCLAINEVRRCATRHGSAQLCSARRKHHFVYCCVIAGACFDVTVLAWHKYTTIFWQHFLFYKKSLAGQYTYQATWAPVQNKSNEVWNFCNTRGYEECEVSHVVCLQSHHKTLHSIEKILVLKFVLSACIRNERSLQHQKVEIHCPRGYTSDDTIYCCLIINSQVHIIYFSTLKISR